MLERILHGLRWLGVEMGFGLLLTKTCIQLAYEHEATDM